MKEARGEGSGEEPWNFFLNVIFPDQHLRILAQVSRLLTPPMLVLLVSKKLPRKPPATKVPAAATSLYRTVDGITWLDPPVSVPL